MKKVGFLGGSFDPIHFGHIHLGLSLQEAHGLEEVIVCPAEQSPLKGSHHKEGEHRLEMVKLAIADIPTWRILDWEMRKGPPSYTIDTIRYLLKDVFDRENVQLYILLGEDLLAELSQWKEVEELFKLALPLIGCRHTSKRPLNPALDPRIQAGMTVTKVLEISATEIRDRLKKRLYCGHLLPAKVLDYITIHQLY